MSKLNSKTKEMFIKKEKKSPNTLCQKRHQILREKNLRKNVDEIHP
jgi:hypothetical protein